MADLGDLVAKLLLDATGWAAGMKKAEEDTKSGAGGIEAALGGIGAGIGAMTGALAAVGLSEKVLEFGQAAVEASNEFNKFASAIKNMRGDSKEVEDFLTNVDNIADKSPFEFPELAASAQRMVQLGGNLDDVQNTLQGVVDMGTALKFSAEQVQGVMTSMGNLQAGMDPLRVMNQLVKQGVPAWQMLAEETGKSIGEVKAAVKDGSISNKEIVDAMTANMGKYHEAAENWGKGFKGSMKALNEAIDENMKGIGGSINNALNTVAAPALRAIASLIDKGAELWGNLAGPIQTAVIAFGAIVAAIAPLVALWPVISGGLAALAGAFAGPILPIAALVAALIALGAWVGEHWEGISDVLTHAWDALVAIWGPTWDAISMALQAVWATIAEVATAVWGGIVAFFSTAFDVIVGIWSAIWNTITTVLTTVWGAMFSGAKGIFSPLIDWLAGLFEPVLAAWNKIAGFLSPILAKIGATGDVLSKAFSGITEEMGKAVPASDKLAKSGKGVSGAMDDTSKSAKQQEDKFKPLVEQNQLLTAIYGKEVAAQKKLVDEIVSMKMAQEKLTASGKTLYDVLDAIPEPTLDFSKALKKADEEATKVFATLKDGVPTVERAEQALKDMGVESTRVAEANRDQARDQLATIQSAGDMVSKYDLLAASTVALKKEIEFLSKAGGDNTAQLDALEKQLIETTTQMDTMKMTTVEAYHQMGMKTTDEMNALATNAQHAYEKIVADAGSNSVAAQQAWVTKTQETYANILAQGGTLTQGQKSELDRAKQQLETHLTTTASMWKTTYDGVKGTVSGFVDDAIQKLVHGDFSFAESVKGMLQDLASTVIHTFIDPFKDAIANFIATSLADLLSGKGLGGVLDSLKEIGSAATSVFKSGSGLVGEGAIPGGIPGGVPGTVPSGGGGAGGAASAVSGGLTGWISAISGAVTAISSVIGNFQMAKMETSLNGIEHNTRYSMMFLGERSDGGILGVLFKIDEEIAWGANTKATERLRDLFLDWSGPTFAATMDLLTLAQNSTAYIADIASMVGDMLNLTAVVADSVRMMADVMRSQGARSITVNVTAAGLTTAEAARALGNQIAQNLSGQMVAIR